MSRRRKFDPVADRKMLNRAIRAFNKAAIEYTYKELDARECEAAWNHVQVCIDRLMESTAHVAAGRKA